MQYATKRVFTTAAKIKSDLAELVKPPSEPLAPATEQVLPHSLVKGTRGYLEKVVYQVNGAYQHGWFDACAVMIRRLVETIIIEAFEKHGLSHKIKNDDDDFIYLRDLISAALTESSWNLGRNTKSALPKLKDVGDRSAHSRRYNAQRQYIDELIQPLREVTQEFIYLAELK